MHCHYSVLRCWDEVKARSNYTEEVKRVETFNSRNRWKKLGLSLVPTKFGISFTAKHLNQAGALVQVKHLAMLCGKILTLSPSSHFHPM
jgi:xanthine dehydrogenase molybdopterin-binding subunit B